MHILVCIVFSEFFLPKKVTLPWSNHILKIQWDIPFFEAPSFCTKRSIFLKNSNYKGLCVKTAFKNNFGLQEVPQPENS